MNPVSFKDGTKFQNKIGDHKELRRVSDEICREHGLSVLENSNFYSGNKNDYLRHKAGKKTHRDYLREDVEYCLTFATSPREFESQLYALGYTLDPVRFSVKAKHWERSVRLANIGFTKEIVQAQLDKNAVNRYRLFTLEYKPPYRPKKFPLEGELRKLEFSIDHIYDAATVLVDTIFYLVITVIQIAAELADVMLLSPDLRAAEKDLKELIADYRFMQEHDIHTVANLQANIDERKMQLSDLDRERKTLSNRIRRPKSPEDESKNKESRKAISRQSQMYAIRDIEEIKERLLSFGKYAENAAPNVLVTLIQTFVEHIYITDENDERHCHIFIKGCSKEDYDDFLRATGYIENTQETGAVTSVLPVCDSEECCKYYIILTPILAVG